MASQKRQQLCGCGIGPASTLLSTSHFLMGTLFAAPSEARVEPWPKRLSFQGLAAHHRKDTARQTGSCREAAGGGWLKELLAWIPLVRAGCRPLPPLIRKQQNQALSYK